MKNRYSKYHLWLAACSLWLLPSPLLAQVPPASLPAEKICVFTDRSTYITGETVLFSAWLDAQPYISGFPASRILYAELVKPDGSRVNGGKYILEEHHAAGCLEIPEDITTGFYYLKSYTRYMRNGSQENYAYSRLRIINPYRNELLTGNDHPDTPGGKFISNPKAEEAAGSIRMEQTRFHSGEEVSLGIELNPRSGKTQLLCLSVVPDGTCDSISSFSGSPNAAPENSHEIYHPETRGISLSGKFVENGTGEPVRNGQVSLSVIGDHDVMAIRADSSGRFYFALPDYGGSHDIFLCGEEVPGKSTELLIDNDFCSRPVGLPAPGFSLSAEEKETVLKMAANQKITSVYHQNLPGENDRDIFREKPFYGKPDEILVMDKYIDLPTMEDYFSELVGTVNVRKHEEKKVFRFNSNRTEMLIYDPLVLVDYVTVNDIGKILSLSPRQLDRIELVNAPYIKGSITYGGIISFISKNNDFGGIDLPSSGTFIHYQFLSECRPAVFSVALLPNIPDSRNTVYWDPDIKTDDEGKAGIVFTAPATPGKYLVVLRAAGNSGNYSEIRKSFEVLK